MDTVLDTTRAETTNSRPLVSWRSIIAGFVVALFADMILLALGVAIGGVSLIDGLQVSIRNAGLMSDAWMIASTSLSLFAGSYFAARISKYAAPLVGSAQGIVISALFFGILAYQMAMALGIVGQAVVISPFGTDVDAARALATTAWSMLAMMVVGLFFSILGGFLGSRENVVKPLSRAEYRPVMRPAVI